MGCFCSKQRPQIFEDPSLLSSQSRFTPKEVKKLNELFRKLGSTLVDDGFLNRDEFKLGLFQDSKQQSVIADRHNLYDHSNGEYSSIWICNDRLKRLDVCSIPWLIPLSNTSKLKGFFFQPVYERRNTKNKPPLIHKAQTGKLFSPSSLFNELILNQFWEHRM
ncbi:uncharacterized protein LOC121770994 isoform X2 [Salvia splendens]|uniref:uncharacterized protein LOC121770994 isoform X2 n=1 Tax=Salvia splendens TaxID=180675 RepID=UPI001C277AD5|nr:uncharacterized protein LOC121770994 isoform X2 [Salvia splendens]